MFITILLTFLFIKICSAGPMDDENVTRSSDNCSEDERYTIVSYTADGKECMSNCIDGYCWTSWVGCEPCTPGYKKAHKYYTSRYKQPNYSQCVGRCGNFGSEYTWCTVYNGDDVKWDYCNDQTEKRQITIQYTSRFGPCRTDCDYYGRSYQWCYTWWDGLENRDYCDPLKFTIDQVKTVYDRDCRVECKKREGKNYFWCYDSARQARLCAPPADF